MRFSHAFRVSALAAVLLLPSGCAFGSHPSSTTRHAIAMGRADMTGGSTRLGEIDPLAIASAGSDAAGSLCNDLAGGPVIAALQFSIVNGNAHSVTIGTGDAVPFDEDGKAYVAFPTGQGLSGLACCDYRISALVGTDAAGENLVLDVTPSPTPNAFGR
jgi:hypothetical protein